MEDEVCMFSKFGYCRFREKCKRRHFSEICELNGSCESTKTCPKRHPRKCNKYETKNGCRFGFACSYQHSKHHVANEAGETKYIIELKEKINHLENTVEELTNKVEGMNVDKLEQMDKVVRALVRKVLSLESNLEEMKRKKEIEGLGATNEVKIKEIETEKSELKENCSINKVLFHNNDIKDSCSTPKKNKGREK